MNPSDYPTFAAYYGIDGKIIFGLTNHEFGTEGTFNPQSRGIDSLDYALTVTERDLRVSLGRALMDIVIESPHILDHDLIYPRMPLITSLEVALLHVFSNPHYRRNFIYPTTRELPVEQGANLVNLSNRLKGRIKNAYVRMVESLLPKPILTT